MANLIVLFLSLTTGFAESGTGRAAAAKYFASEIKALDIESSQSQSRVPASTVTTQGLGRRIGVFAGAFSQSPRDSSSQQSIGGWAVRFDYQRDAKPGSYFTKGYQLALQKFRLAGEELSNVAFLWSFRFPKEVVFPVYVGVAFGPGVFTRQARDVSWLSFDTKAFAGFRLDAGVGKFYLEGGVKNQFLVLSSGQYQGWFVSSGVAYAF